MQDFLNVLSTLCLLGALVVLGLECRSDRTRLMLVLFLASAMLSGCTLATYTDNDGRELTVFDVRLSGTATQISVTRPDGTTVNINRDQDSPEGTLTGVINVATPLGGLAP